MRKILFIQYALLIFYCSSEDENYLAESISVNGTNIYAAGYYIDGYPNGTHMPPIGSTANVLSLVRVKLLIYMLRMI